MPLTLTENARAVMEARYLRRDKDGAYAETPEQCFQRVALAISQAEVNFGGAPLQKEWHGRFHDLLTHFDFIPNSPTLMNAGTPLGQLCACFVLPVEDSIEGIFDALKLTALIQQSGGGTGFAFSRLRAKGDRVLTTGGTASGPVSFMRIFDCATENIRQGGKRRGANMGILRVDHPDVIEFIQAKMDKKSFRNFNLSIGITKEFLSTLESGKDFSLKDPLTGRITATHSADTLMQLIAEAAWATGDPGLIFLDLINESQPLRSVGEIEATNPCGEVPLLPYEACNLGSLNLSHMVRESQQGKREIDWEKLSRTAEYAVRFLDDVIEVGRWPDKRIEQAIKSNRKIGLGVMGFAELLFLLDVPYDSPQALTIAEHIAKHLSDKGFETSRELAKERGAFPNWEKSRFAREKRPLRNATVLSIAPTGTISILANTSAGIEPLFALAYHRENVLEGQRLYELNPVFVRVAKEKGIFSQSLVEQLERLGSLGKVPGIADEIRGLFKTALEIAPEQHLAIQAAFQKHVDNAVSKTINLPESATVADIRRIYEKAATLNVKGITIYRYGSLGTQVLNLGAYDSAIERENFVHCDPSECKL